MVELIRRFPDSGKDHSCEPTLGPCRENTVATCLQCGQRLVLRRSSWKRLRWHHLQARWRYGIVLSTIDRYRRQQRSLNW